MPRNNTLNLFRKCQSANVINSIWDMWEHLTSLTSNLAQHVLKLQVWMCLNKWDLRALPRYLQPTCSRQLPSKTETKPRKWPIRNAPFRQQFQASYKYCSTFYTTLNLEFQHSLGFLNTHISKITILFLCVWKKILMLTNAAFVWLKTVILWNIQITAFYLNVF